MSYHKCVTVFAVVKYWFRFRMFTTVFTGAGLLVFGLLFVCFVYFYVPIFRDVVLYRDLQHAQVDLRSIRFVLSHLDSGGLITDDVF